jgi:hypothetical protein
VAVFFGVNLRKLAKKTEAVSEGQIAKLLLKRNPLIYIAITDAKTV